jgi:hypothetical protein
MRDWVTANGAQASPTAGGVANAHPAWRRHVDRAPAHLASAGTHSLPAPVATNVSPRSRGINARHRRAHRRRPARPLVARHDIRQRRASAIAARAPMPSRA